MDFWKINLPLFLLCGNLYSQTLSVTEGTVVFETDASTAGVESSFTGEGKSLSGSWNKETGEFSFVFQLKSLKTGIRLRDNHMHEDYLETDKFPLAIFTGFISPSEKNEWVAEGELLLHGVKRKEKIIGSVHEHKIQAQWKLKLTDYGIDVPTRFLVAKLSEIITVTITAKMEEK